MERVFFMSVITCVLQVAEEIKTAESNIKKYSQQWQSSLLTLQKQDAEVIVSAATRIHHEPPLAP
jgi:hypothetical protein